MKRQAKIMAILLSAFLFTFGCGGGGGTPPPSQSSQPPIVVTGSATDITSTGATLHAGVTTNGLDTVAYFEYSTDPQLAGAIKSPDQMLGTASQPIFHILTNLAPSTTYYFRVMASSAGGAKPGSILIFTTLSSPPVPTTWIKKIGRNGSNEYSRTVEQTADGGYVIGGIIGSDFYLIKTDINGNTVWERIFPGPVDYLVSAIPTSDGGYLITGALYDTNPRRIRLIKTNTSGDPVWIQTLNTGATANSVQQASDGGYILFGSIASADGGNACLTKTDALGNVLWTKLVGGTNAYSGQQTTDGGYIVAGTEYFPYPIDKLSICLIKADAAGNALWKKTFGQSAYDYGWSVQQTADGGYILTGETYPPGSQYRDIVLIKTDSSGNTVWLRTIGAVALDETGFSVRQTTDGGYVIGGYKFNFQTFRGYVYLVKTDASGAVLWERTFGETGDNLGSCVRQTSDGGYIITGDTIPNLATLDSDIYLIKTDASGNAASQSGAVLDQSYVPSSLSWSNGVQLKSEQAQTFTVGISGTLSGIDVQIGQGLGFYGDLLIDIRPTLNGIPVESDAITLASAVLPFANAPYPLNDFVHFDLSAFQVPVAAGQVLAIVLRAPAGSYSWTGSMENAYPGGQVFTRNPDYGFPVWTSTAGVAGFKTYVIPH